MMPLPDPGWLALIAICIPLVGVVGILTTRRWPDVREGISLAAGSVLFCTVMTIAMAMDAGETVHLELARPLTGVTIALTVDSLGLLFAIVASFLWIVTTVYAIGYMRGHHEKNQ
ncbi:MAG: monovalent cation/H+ antiporter subunit D family protein, partial [Alphaproteobacteria bacterium]